MNEERTSVEKAVVGCMLIDSRAIDEFTAQGGDPSWFADPTCRTVAGAICQRYADGKCCVGSHRGAPGCRVRRLGDVARRVH
jgi:hypothetical protein